MVDSAGLRPRFERACGLAISHAAGEPIGDRDVWMAFLALQHGRTFVSRNGRHFRGVSELLLGPTELDSSDDGLEEGAHNLVLIEHPDSSFAFYAHLLQFGIDVAVGERTELAESPRRRFLSEGRTTIPR